MPAGHRTFLGDTQNLFVLNYITSWPDFQNIKKNKLIAKMKNKLPQSQEVIKDLNKPHMMW